MSQPRTLAREYAMQGLYQWRMSGSDLNTIERYLRDEFDFKKVHKSYFKKLLHGVPAQLNRIDDALGQYTDRPVKSLDPVEQAILRLGVYELLNQPDVPYRVVINEGINLAKRYGASASHKYVNSILDKVATAQRAVEQRSSANERSEAQPDAAE